MADRREWQENITTVRHVATPLGMKRENPPCLADLRIFVDACEGLPDDTHVYIEKGSLDEGGRHTYTFSLRIVQTSDEA